MSASCERPRYSYSSPARSCSPAFESEERMDSSSAASICMCDCITTCRGGHWGSGGERACRGGKGGRGGGGERKADEKWEAQRMTRCSQRGRGQNISSPEALINGPAIRTACTAPPTKPSLYLRRPRRQPALEVQRDGPEEVPLALLHQPRHLLLPRLQQPLVVPLLQPLGVGVARALSDTDCVLPPEGRGLRGVDGVAGQGAKGRRDGSEAAETTGDWASKQRCPSPPHFHPTLIPTHLFAASWYTAMQSSTMPCASSRLSPTLPPHTD